MQLRRKGLITLAFVAFLSGRSLGADVSVKRYADAMKGDRLLLRCDVEVFGKSRESFGGRPILEADFTLKGDDVAIDQSTEFLGKYFVSQRPYTVKEVKYDASKDRLQMKLRGDRVARNVFEDEVRLDFPNASQLTQVQFEKIVYAVFFKPGESIPDFVAWNDRKLIEAYIDPEKELAGLPYGDKKKLLDSIRLLSVSPKPEIYRAGEALYITVPLLPDGSDYNDIKVSKNQRIASSIESAIPRLKSTSRMATGIPVVAGIRFSWKAVHHDFLNESAGHTVDDIELLTPFPVLSDFSNGNLSAFEMVQKSVLRVDGTKVTLTSYEPIGGR